MSLPLFEHLHSRGLISDISLQKVITRERTKLLSVHWEIKVILYAGVLMLTSGLSVLVYKNIDSIGHQAILAVIGLICVGSFAYCDRNKLPFATSRVKAPNAFFDYILLLACLTLIIFITYLQFQYTAFGTAYGLATFIPMTILFFTAYYFDHLGILSMAITNLAAWLGLAVTPARVLKDNNFNDTAIIGAGLLLGVLLTLAGRLSEERKIKAHFAFTYQNFALNIWCIASLAGMFYYDSYYVLWMIVLGAGIFWFYREALRQHSFYFMLMLSIYSYIGVSYFLTRLLLDHFPDAYLLGFLYFIGSGAAMIAFLISMNKKLKRHDSV